MRKTLLSGFLICSFTLLLAQSVPGFSYQAVVRNQNNELVVNEQVNILLTFYNSSPYTTPLYSEQHSVMSNSNGLIHLMVGEGTAQVGSLENVSWSEAFLCVKFSISGGYVISDTTRISAAPYAYYAEKVPLSAIQEHLGTADLVTTSALGDSLANYSREGEWQLALNNYLPRAEFIDSLNHITNNGTLAQILQDMQEEIAELQSVTSTVDEFSVPGAPSNTFHLTHAPIPNREVQMYINGVHVSASAHVVTSSTLTYISTANGGKVLATGDRIQIYYYYKSL